MQFFSAAVVFLLAAVVSHEADAYQSNYAGLPSCPSYFVVPFHSCRWVGRDSGFCYNPDKMDPEVTMQKQEKNWMCLSGLDMGFDGTTKRMTCPADKPKMCQFTGSAGGLYNDIMYLGWIMFPGAVITYSLYTQNEARDGSDTSPKKDALSTVAGPVFRLFQNMFVALGLKPAVASAREPLLAA